MNQSVVWKYGLSNKHVLSFKNNGYGQKTDLDIFWWCLEMTLGLTRKWGNCGDLKSSEMPLLIQHHSDTCMILSFAWLQKYIPQIKSFPSFDQIYM